MKEIKTKNNYNFFLVFSFLFLFLLSDFLGFYNTKVRRIKSEYVDFNSDYYSLRDETISNSGYASFSVNSEYETTHFIFKYDNNAITTSMLFQFENTIEDAYSLFYQNGNGFNLPLKREEDDKYTIYLTNEQSDNIRGVTFANSAILSNNAPFCSYIIIYDVRNSTLNDRLETLAHEYFHAIQYAYTGKSNFFTEACANLAKILVKGYCNSSTEAIENFISSLLSLYSLSTEYGAVLFPYVLYTMYGGLDTIKNLYERFTIHPTSFGTMLESDFVSDINYVLSSYSFNNGSVFNDCFAYLSAYCAYPLKFFNSILSSSYHNYLNNSNIANNTVTFNNDSNSDNFSFNIYRKGRYYKKYSLNCNNLVFNISATYSLNDIGIIILKETVNGDVVSDFIVNFNNNFSFYVDSSIYQAVVFNVVNLNDNYTGSYSINVSANHVHNYNDRYEFYSNSKHYSYCDCNSYIFENHVIYSNSIIILGNKRFAPCIFCEELLDLSRCLAEVIL